MEITLAGNKLMQDLSIGEALALQAGLADAIKHALKHRSCAGPTICCVTTTFGNDNRPMPLAVSFNIRNEYAADNW